jgi:3-dehydrosphinganine reductase
MKTHKVFPQLESQIVFIFGGSEGIGLSMAQDCAQSGAHVAIFSRSQNKLQQALKSLSPKNSNQKLRTYSCDVTNLSESQMYIEKAIQDIGEPDILLNVAGYAKPGFFHEQSVEDMKKMMDLNLFGSIHTCKTIVPYMIKNKKGIILNTSSMCGFLGLFGYTGYCASKFAVVGFSEALRRELKPFGIQVSVLCPPNTRTPGLQEENKNKPQEVLATEEKAKVVDPEYVSRATFKDLFQKKFMIIPTFDGNLAYYLNRISPKIIDLFVKRSET